MKTYFIDARSATPHFPGIGRYVTNLVAAQLGQITADEELQVLIPPAEAQLREQEQPWSSTLPATDQLHFLESTASTFGLAQQWSVPRLIRQARHLLGNSLGQRQERSAIYHSPYYLMSYPTGLPNIVTFHDLIAIVLPESVSARARYFFRLSAYLTLRATSHVIIGTESARQELLKHFAIAPERVTTIPHAPAARFHRQSEEDVLAVRASYQLPDRFLFYCGINKPHKNLVRLVDAYAELPVPTPPLVIAGAWDERYPESKERAMVLGLGERVRFLGRVSDQDLPALYAAATLFVFPSLYEGFGLPVIEAMACGAPVACSDATGLRDVAGDAALLFDPQDTDSIVRTLRTAIENESLLAEMRTRSFDQAKRFTWASTAQQTLSVYCNVLQQKAP